MKPHVLLPALVLLFTFSTVAAPDEPKLISVEANDEEFVMKIVELERGEKISRLRMTHEKLGSSVGSSMFVMYAFHQVAKARGAKYFINLKEWDEGQGGWIYIAGFTNRKDADLKKEFGGQYDYQNDSGQPRQFMSVAEWEKLFGPQLELLKPKEKTREP